MLVSVVFMFKQLQKECNLVFTKRFYLDRRELAFIDVSTTERVIYLKPLITFTSIASEGINT